MNLLDALPTVLEFFCLAANTSTTAWQLTSMLAATCYMCIASYMWRAWPKLPLSLTNIVHTTLEGKGSCIIFKKKLKN